MTHKGTKEIVTDRFVLRRFTPDDAEAMYENWASDEKTVKYLSWEIHHNPEHTRALLESWVTNYEKADYYSWFIELDGKPIGSINLHDISDRKASCEVGYCLGSAWWNMGIMTQALRAVIDFLFTEVGMHRICAFHDAENAASGRVMQKAGMLYEGTLRDHSLRKDGTYGNMCVYGILESDRASGRDKGVWR